MGGCWGSRGQYPIQRAANRTLWRGATYVTRGLTPPPPLPNVSVYAENLARSGFVRVTSSPSPDVSLLTNVPGGTDQLQVRGTPVNVIVSVASSLSPTGLLFPFLDSGLASLPPSLPSSVSSTPLSSFSLVGWGGGGVIFCCSFLSSYFSSFCRSFCSSCVCCCSYSCSFASSCCCCSFFLSSWPFLFLSLSLLSPLFLLSLLLPLPLLFLSVALQLLFCLLFLLLLLLVLLPSSGLIVRFVFGVSVVGALVYSIGGVLIFFRMLLLSSLTCPQMLVAISLLVLPSSFQLSAPWLRLLLLLLLLLVLRSFHLSLPLPTASLSVPAAAPPVLLRPSFASSFPHPPVSTPVPSAPPLGFSTPAVHPPPGFSASAASSFPSFAQSVPLPAPSPTPSAPGFSLLLLCLCFRGLLFLRFLWLHQRFLRLRL